MLIDTHIHLTDSSYVNLTKILKAAHTNDVKYMISCSVNLEDSIKNKQLAEKYNNIFWTGGCHPHDASSFSDEDKQKIQDLLTIKDSKLVAIGEVGLDFFYEYSCKNRQVEVFQFFIELAELLKLPIVIHSRNAEKEVYNQLQSKKLSNIIIHSYTGEKNLLKSFVEMGAFISFNGMLSFKKAENIRELAKIVPIDQVLIETDGPYLAPIPYRGKKNKPEYLIEILKVLAKIRNINIEELQKILLNNSIKAFNLANNVK